MRQKSLDTFAVGAVREERPSARLHRTIVKLLGARGVAALDPNFTSSVALGFATAA
jgi:hypothetical protein